MWGLRPKDWQLPRPPVPKVKDGKQGGRSRGREGGRREKGGRRKEGGGMEEEGGAGGGGREVTVPQRGDPKRGIRHNKSPKHHF